MSPTPDRTLDPQQLIAELQRQLAECRAERDEAQQQLIERTAERRCLVAPARDAAVEHVEHERGRHQRACDIERAQGAALEIPHDREYRGRAA